MDAEYRRLLGLVGSSDRESESRATDEQDTCGPHPDDNGAGAVA